MMHTVGHSLGIKLKKTHDETSCKFIFAWELPYLINKFGLELIIPLFSL